MGDVSPKSRQGHSDTMEQNQNAGTESPASEPAETENSQDTQTSAQATPPELDLGELLSSLSPDELRQLPQIKKLVDDTAAAVKAKYKPRSGQKAKQEPKTPAQPDASNDDPPEWFGALMDRMESIASTVETLQSAREQDTFEGVYAASGLPDAIKQDVKDLASVRKPKDLSKFLADYKKKHGIADAPAQPDQQTQSQSDTKPKGTPSPGAPPNGGDKDFDGIVNPFTLSGEDVRRLRESGRLLEVAERWRKRNQPKRFGPGKR